MITHFPLCSIKDPKKVNPIWTPFAVISLQFAWILRIVCREIDTDQVNLGIHAFQKMHVSSFQNLLEVISICLMTHKC